MNLKSICILLLCSLTSTLVSKVNGQVVHEVKYKHQADIVLYKVLYPSQADVIAAYTEYAQQADPEEGIWHKTNYAQKADLKIYWTPYRNEAACQVYIAENPAKATRNTCYLQWKREKVNAE